ncbi:MAG: hypothetical protein ACI9WU_002817, partial [Myxococcota bacterium]
VNVDHDGDVKVNAPRQRQRRGPRQFQPISGRTAWSDSDQQSSPDAASKSRPMNIVQTDKHHSFQRQRYRLLFGLWEAVDARQ